MAWKRYSDEDVLRLLREIELHLASGKDVSSTCRSMVASCVKELQGRADADVSSGSQAAFSRALLSFASGLHRLT
jgi:hypothetical protein